MFHPAVARAGWSAERQDCKPEVMFSNEWNEIILKFHAEDDIRMTTQFALKVAAKISQTNEKFSAENDWNES